MKVYITGGFGQVGSTVTNMLLERGDTVFSIDDFCTGRRDNLDENANLTSVEGSIVDSDLVEQTMEEFQPDVVIHTAASYKDPDDWYSDALVNGAGTANIAKSAKNHNVGRLIYFQTALCYGAKPIEQPITLNHPLNPDNCSYAISKTCGENYVQHSGLDWVTFRLANVIGERNVSGPLPIFYGRLKEGKKCFVTEARRDFCYARDLAKVVVKASDGNGNGTYHFSSGKDVAIKELYDAVVTAMKLNDYPEPEVRPLAPDDVASILLDPSRLHEDFGDIEITPLAEIAQAAVDRWERDGVVGGYTHLKEAREDVNTQKTSE